MTKPLQERSAGQAAAVLGASPPFDVLDAGALDALARCTQRVRLARGQVYQQRGARVEGIVVVTAGFLRISLSNPQGKRHVVAFLEPGQVFNLLPVVDGGPAIHDAEAGVDAELLVLPTAAYIGLLRSHPEVGLAAQRVLNDRARRVYDGLADAMLLTLAQRCARSLLQVMDALGEPAAPAGAVIVHLAQGELADMLGNARPVVNRVLRQLQRDGVIELGYQRIVVLQPDALRRVAGG